MLTLGQVVRLGHQDHGQQDGGGRQPGDPARPPGSGIGQPHDQFGAVAPPGCVRVVQFDISQPAGGGRRHDGNCNNERRDNRESHRQGQIREELAGNVLQENDRQEYGDGGRCRGDKRTPDLAGACQCGDFARRSFLPQPNDVLEDHDRRIQHHTDGKGETGQRDDVDRSACTVECNECDEYGDRDRKGNHHRRPETPHEPPQNRDCQRDAKQQVVAQHRDRLIDVNRFVVILRDEKSRALDRTFIQFRDGGL